MFYWYILNTIITFETDVVSPQEMTKRIQGKLIRHDWLVGEVNREIIGYAYYGLFRNRAAYHHSVESTIYLSQGSMGQGFGRTLYAKLLESVKDHGFREVIGVIALPNSQSIALHRTMGFAEAGVLIAVFACMRPFSIGAKLVFALSSWAITRIVPTTEDASI